MENVTVHDDKGKLWYIRRSKTIKVRLPNGHIVSMYKRDAKKLVAKGEATWLKEPSSS